MSRKSLILALAALFATVLALGVAIAFLYSDTMAGVKDRKVSPTEACSCLEAVPSDAVLVVCGSEADRTCSDLLSFMEIPDSLAAADADGALASLRRCPMSVSLHYSGKLIPLYVFGVGNVSDVAAALLKEKLAALGCHVETNGDFLIASGSETLVRSASRHVDSGVSVLDAPGFADAMKSVGGKDLMFVPHLQFRRLLSAAGDKALTKHSSFIERIADWTALEIGAGDKLPVSLKGVFRCDGDQDEFTAVLEKCIMSSSKVAEVLPAYTVSCVALQVSDSEAYASAYKSFMDSRQQLQSLQSKCVELERKTGVVPEELFSAFEIQEVASAVFMSEGRKEKVNLLRVGDRNVSLIFKGNAVTSLRNYSPAVHSWAYPSFASSVFGGLFALKDESCFTFVDGWIITGSRTAIEEYVCRNALDYTLSQYLADAGKPGLLSVPSAVVAYYSLTEGRPETLLGPMVRNIVAEALDAECAPVVLAISNDKKNVRVSADVYALTLKKSKAPLFDRDTTVSVPLGPFKVKNSHTGKSNTFYQNSSKAICLRDETGKDLWGVPLGKPLCGTAYNVDYYANGKLQILFGAGSSIYLIDRLGRYVTGFPLDLGREILMGPDVYDFSGARRYNIMVLHKDNVIDMYNLKGRKPEQWKGITAEETIKGLPQRLTLAGKDFWVVRTSIQTLIFPFYGGEPLTVFEGDYKIRPDSEIRPVDGTAVEFNCYDGKKRTIKLK